MSPRIATACLSLITIGVLSLGPSASAQVIISDTFAGGGDGATMEGRNPEVDLPGGPWLKATNQGSWRTTLNATLNGGFGNPLPGSFGTFQSASAVSLASAGTYVKPPLFTISADLSPKDVVGPASAGRGIALGFFSAVASGQQFSQNFFTGLVLDAAGNLNLVSDPNPTGFFGAGSTLLSPVAFGGTFDPNAFHRLSYDVNTGTGIIANIRLGASTADYSSLTAPRFTDMATAFAGMYESSAVASGLSALDNFLVVVPEASTMALGLLTGVGLLGMRRRV
jgi:hypothetical protein